MFLVGILPDREFFFLRRLGFLLDLFDLLWIKLLAGRCDGSLLAFGSNFVYFRGGFRAHGTQNE